jgi:hypothetical protein
MPIARTWRVAAGVGTVTALLAGLGATASASDGLDLRERGAPVTVEPVDLVDDPVESADRAGGSPFDSAQSPADSPGASAADSPAPVEKKPPAADSADSPASVEKKSWSDDSGGLGGSGDRPTRPDRESSDLQCGLPGASSPLPPILDLSPSISGKSPR